MSSSDRDEKEFSENRGEDRESVLRLLFWHLSRIPVFTQCLKYDCSRDGGFEIHDASEKPLPLRSFSQNVSEVHADALSVQLCTRPSSW